MYFQYNHPTNKSQQKPFDKNRQNLIPLHPPQRRFHTPPHNADSTLTPQRIKRSADAPPPPGKPQGNSAPAAIQRSADGSPTPVRPPRPHTPKNQNGQTASGTAARQKTQTLSMPRRNDRTRHDHAAAPLADCPFVPPFVPPPHKKRAPRSKHPGTLPKLKYPIIINRYQLSPTITQRAAETSESPSHWKPSQSQPQDS